MKLSNEIPFLFKNIILTAIVALASLLFIISNKVIYFNQEENFFFFFIKINNFIRTDIR